ncbi:tyrosine-protein phosphatase 99A-like isoform X4 [Amphibalanus amphitrite]|uniref:tyrosine-protein phosphatase 99A-like isoform X4 n=1 Tax=Amphibalanus amphitrite TaxID=1232801 RepID=UPI001C9225EA|nr:tyrosine-protein phosphatase 99A-like isoform X4 [Amphibalanus amphitrite]
MGASPPGEASYHIITLREAPGGKPVILAAHNTSATSVRLRWRPLAADQLRGEFQSYRITYRERNATGDRPREVRIPDEETQSHTITGLRPFTQYLVSLQVENPAGFSPSTTVVVTTEEGVPDAPRNLTVVNVTATTATIAWLPPAQPAGRIEGYRIYSTLGNFTNATWIRDTGPALQYTLRDLKPNSTYSLAVKPFTSKHEGRYSASAELLTQAAPPDPPRLLHAACESGAAVRLWWQRPSLAESRAVRYLVQSQPAAGGAVSELQVPAREGQYRLSNLTAGVTYKLWLVAESRDTAALRSAPSESRLVEARQRCPPAGGGGGGGDSWLDGGGTTLLVGCLCAALALLLAITALLLWRRQCRSSYLYLEEWPSVRTPLDSDPAWLRDGPNGAPAPVAASQFPLHVAALHADSDIGFCKEYDEILEHTSKLGLPSETSQVEENKKKNRYQNIDAYDHTLVPLRPVPGQRRGDYINANYIDGFLVRNQYIGAQGPLPHTFHAFWRLIWEQRVQVIVMITNLVERSRKKCDMYWPKEGSETYGLIQVVLLDERELATYTVRKLLIRHSKKGRPVERTVYQYHYTNWPDHGVPDHPLPILSFVRKSAAANGDGAGPILVHCSAGVGRTGTYIVLDAMMNMLQQRGSVNVFGFLKHIRTQRNFLVQTEDQYVFIHDALLEALDSGDTEVRAERLPEYLERLRSADVSVYPCHTLDRQYQLITQYQADEYELAAALASYNQAKNRSRQFVPSERWRVHLSPRPGVEGSDYINATALIGYERLREFIITQHPLTHTVEDFWRMVWDHNVQTVVVLTPADDEEYPPFWPTLHEDIDSESFRVRLVEHRPSAVGYTVELQLQSTQDDYQVSVRVLGCPGWPHVSEPAHRLIDRVQRATLKYQDGPLLVVDRYGGTEAATFCCLTTLSKQLRDDGAVDVYMCAKLYHMRRPGVWQTQDDYTALYHSVEGLARPAVSPTPSVQSEAESLLRPGTLARRNGSLRAPPDGRESYLRADCV